MRIALQEGTQFVESMHKFIPLRQAMKILDAKAAVDKKWEKIKKCQHESDQSQERKRGHQRGTERGEYSPFCYADGHMPPKKNSELEPKLKKIQWTCCTPGWQCEAWFRLLRSIYGAGFVSITKDGRKSDGCQSKTTTMCRTSSRCSSRLYPSQNGGRSKVAKKSQVRMSRHLDTSATTQVAQHLGPTLKIQYIVTHVPDYCGKTILASKARSTPLGTRGRHKSCVEEIDETRWAGRTYIVSWSRVLGMHSTRMQIEREYYWWTQKIFRGWEKCHANTIAWSDDMGGHANCGRSLLHVLTTINSKREDLETVGDLSKVCSPIVLWNTRIWHALGRPDIPWSVNKQTRAVTKVDRSMWQTVGSFDFVHPQHEWLQTMLSCGEYGWTLQINTVSEFRFCWGPWGLKINLGENLTYFWKSIIRFHKLGCARSKRQYPTVPLNLKL